MRNRQSQKTGDGELTQLKLSSLVGVVVGIYLAFGAPPGPRVALADPLAPDHTSVRTADPGPSDTVEGPLELVTLTFFDPVLGADIEVFGPNGAAVDSSAASRLSADGLEVGQRFDPMTAPGRYEVRYTIANVDGMPQPGAYTFDVVAPDDASSSAWTTMFALAAAVGMVGIVLRRKRQARRGSEPLDSR